MRSGSLYLQIFIGIADSKTYKGDAIKSDPRVFFSGKKSLGEAV